MSLLVPSPLEEKVKTLERESFKPYRFPTCPVHHQETGVTCLSAKCPSYCSLACPSCHSSLCAHAALEVNRLVPRLAQWALGEWGAIQREHRQIEAEWKVCLVNINYCLDILREVRKQVEERGQGPQLVLFPELLGELHGMFTRDSGNQTPEALLRNFARLNERHGLLAAAEEPVASAECEQERQHRKAQVKKASSSTKQFSESALAFSEGLARIVEERVRFEKRVGRLRELASNRVFNLRDLMKEEARPGEVGELMIELPREARGKEGQPIEQLMEQCSNLRSLRVSNRNGAINRHRWARIAQGMDYLKQLTDLSLHLRAADLPVLTALFRERSKAVRQIQRLTLQITDEKELKAGQVSDFLNTMELRALSLTLARDNLRRQQVVELLQRTRLASSMTHLPLTDLQINLNKNRIDDPQDVAHLTELFHQRAAAVKTRSIVI